MDVYSKLRARAPAVSMHRGTAGLVLSLGSAICKGRALRASYLTCRPQLFHPGQGEHCPLRRLFKTDGENPCKALITAPGPSSVQGMALRILCM